MNELINILVGGIVGAIPTIITVVATINKNNALQDERISNIQGEIKELSERVNQHNNYGLQIARLETRVDILEKRGVTK